MLAFILSSCKEVSNMSNPSVTKNSTNDIPVYSVIVIDSCEYIQVVNSGKVLNNYSYSLTHKGNCKNPFHQKR
jgi:hypothetical protein